MIILFADKNLKRLFKNVKIEYILLLIFSFYILDILTTYTRLKIGGLECGMFQQNFSFINIMITKFIGLLLIIVLYIWLSYKDEALSKKAVFFVSGIGSGIAISNIHQIIYLMQYLNYF